MRRYTTVKSNVYAPTSTNVTQQQILHCHMTCHYRMMYNAKSKVDSSAPRHYKGRGCQLPDSSRKKLNKHPVRLSRTKVPHRAEVDFHSQLLVDRILNDTKLPPSAYINECVMQRQCVNGMQSQYVNDSSKNKVEHVGNYRIDTKGACQCQSVHVIPALNLSPKKVRQVSQFRDFVNQPWAKRVGGGHKWIPSHTKHLENPQDVVRNNIPRQISKPRLYHSSQPRRLLFQGEKVCVSSGSEGNAGDDEDGAPTSSYDDSNPSDNEKHKHSSRKITSSDSGLPFKKTSAKRLGEPCICIPALEKTKKIPASEISSRDSAYEGGEGMSSTEKERASPDHVDDRVCHCVGLHFSNESKAESMSCPIPQEEPQFSLRSEFYMKFLQDVTDDILARGVYTNEDMERLFQEHIDKNVYSLELSHLKVMIKKLGEDLGMPIVNISDDKLFDKRTAKQQQTSTVEKGESAEPVWPLELNNHHALVNSVDGKQFSFKSDIENEADGDNMLWANKHFISEETKSSSAVIIDKNITMSKKEILDSLAYLDFDESMAEEIYQILAGKGGTYPDFTLKELQEIIQQ